jgi:hypothetical protein
VQSHSDSSKSLRNLICKGYDSAIIYDSLGQVYVAKIDSDEKLVSSELRNN